MRNFNFDRNGNSTICWQLFKDGSLDVSVETIINNRAKGIALYAAENDVDLIVMSSHPVSPEKRGHGWTTISYQVSAICQCSILLVKQRR